MFTEGMGCKHLASQFCSSHWIIHLVSQETPIFLETLLIVTIDNQSQYSAHAAIAKMRVIMQKLVW